MKSRNILQIVLITVIAVSAFVVLRSSTPGAEPGSCKESLEQCSKKPKDEGADKMIWENLSHQFFSTL